MRRYNEEHLQPRVWMQAFFPTWRSYENVHIFFWLAKDCSWNHGWTLTWWIFSVPTVLIALDFAWQTAHVKVRVSRPCLSAVCSRVACRVAWSTTCTTSCSSCGSWQTWCGPTVSCSFPPPTTTLFHFFLSHRKRCTPCVGSAPGYWLPRSFCASCFMSCGSGRVQTFLPPTLPFTLLADTVINVITHTSILCHRLHLLLSGSCRVLLIFSALNFRLKKNQMCCCSWHGLVISVACLLILRACDCTPRVWPLHYAEQ